MAVRSLFHTLLYQAALDDAALLAELDDACRAIADEDEAGRRWCAQHEYRGYTSYASLDDLTKRDPRFAELKRHLDRHAGRFADASAMELGRRRLKLDSLWVNILEPGTAHPGHIHPLSAVSGTLYVAVPEGAGRLKLEDPRLPLMMAAPARREDAPEQLRPFVHLDPAPGTLLMWESWLRHEVTAGDADGERISVSFNYRV
ncbi:MAG: TIGR02466 family protein [Sphingomonadaceae bacterium]